MCFAYLLAKHYAAFKWKKLHNFWFLPRDAMLCYAVVMCLSLCQSVTLQYCIKTAKRRITQIMPHNSPGTLVLWCQRSWLNSNGITLWQMQVGWVKIRHFRQNTRSNSKMVQDRCIVRACVARMYRFCLVCLCVCVCVCLGVKNWLFHHYITFCIHLGEVWTHSSMSVHLSVQARMSVWGFLPI